MHLICMLNALHKDLRISCSSLANVHQPANLALLLGMKQSLQPNMLLIFY